MKKYTLIIAFGDGGYQQTQVTEDNSVLAVEDYIANLKIWGENRRIVSITVAEEIEIKG